MAKGWNMHGGAFESPLTALDEPEYTDANGVKWQVQWTDSDGHPLAGIPPADGWIHFKARPESGQDNAAFHYKIKVDEYPVVGLVANPTGTALEMATSWAESYKFVGEQIDDWITEKGAALPSKGGFPWWLLLLLALAASDKPARSSSSRRRRRR